MDPLVAHELRKATLKKRKIKAALAIRHHLEIQAMVAPNHPMLWRSLLQLLWSTPDWPEARALPSPLLWLSPKKSRVLKLQGLKFSPSITGSWPGAYLRNSFIPLTWIVLWEKEIINTIKIQFGLSWRLVFHLLFRFDLIHSVICYWTYHFIDMPFIRDYYILRGC